MNEIKRTNPFRTAFEKLPEEIEVEPGHFVSCHKLGLAICLIILALSLFTDVSPVLLVIASALVGIGARTWRRRQTAQKDGSKRSISSCSGNF